MKTEVRLEQGKTQKGLCFKVIGSKWLLATRGSSMPRTAKSPGKDARSSFLFMQVVWSGNRFPVYWILGVDIKTSLQTMYCNIHFQQIWAYLIVCSSLLLMYSTKTINLVHAFQVSKRIFGEHCHTKNTLASNISIAIGAHRNKFKDYFLIQLD